jgi:alkaline phosphatase
MHPELPAFESSKSAKFMASKNADDERTTKYWMEKAMKFVDEQIKRQPIENKAKNIIMFLGDGLSHPTIAATRVLMGNEAEQLSFEKFPYTASSTTYCVDKQVADSACSATAYLTGVKANDATIGLSARATLSNCEDGNDRSMYTESIASWAMKSGKDAGLVTTTRVT